jgi:hypothetical protein
MCEDSCVMYVFIYIYYKASVLPMNLNDLNYNWATGLELNYKKYGWGGH